MPFLAQKENGKAVKPSDVADKFRKKEELECPYCGDALTYRKEATTDAGEKISRSHFWHSKESGGSSPDDSPGGCAAGGESARHEYEKSRVVAHLDNRYNGQPFVERKIGSRVADCGIEYNRQRGDERGVVVEVQFKNTEKDYVNTTKDFLKHGFAVHWVFVTERTWSHLYDAKEELDSETGEDYFLGNTDSRLELGDKLWFHNFPYTIRGEEDLIDPDHQQTRVKVDIGEIDDSVNTYLVVEHDSIDQSDPELSIEDGLRRERPAKSIAKAKFD